MEQRRGLSVRWAFGALSAGAIVGAIFGGAIGAATYTSDPDCAYLCFTQGSYVVYGAILVILFGPLAGLMLWALWAIWASREPRRTT
jgi:hypothetical protein